MKFGKIIYSYGERTSSFAGYNVGDAVQCFAVEKLYQEMGVTREEIIDVDFYELGTYSGEYVILPICGVAVGLLYAVLPFSDRIIPVFISTHIAVSELDEFAIDYLRMYSPIGCRDENTLNTMRRYLIPAYLSGCITLITPKVTRSSDTGTVFFVDTPQGLDKFIPAEIAEHSVQLSHLIPITDKFIGQEEEKKYEKKAAELLERYKNEAAMVVSSRLHALVPCMAMGIPVIAAFENISQRFSWLDKFLPFYTSTSFEKIDWHPQPINCEAQKKMVSDVFKSQLWETYNHWKPLCELSEFYEDRQRAEYGSHYYEKIRSLKGAMPEDFSYAIWGCGLIGNTAVKVMEDVFPKAHLACAIDSFAEGKWQGVDIVNPKEFANSDNSKLFVILASFSGRKDGFELMNSMGKKEGRDYIYIATQNG